MPNFRSFLREQVIFFTVAFVSFSAEPAVLSAQEVNPVPFSKPLSVSRGSVTPDSKEAVYLNQSDTCAYAMEFWGWSDCGEAEVMIWDQLPGVDTTLISQPNNEGYVSFDDWESDEKTEVIAEIERSQRIGLAAQAEALGIDIRFAGWSVHPTLNREKQMMYYATDMIWEGERTININATVFDRRGYVEFMIVPMATEISAAETEAMITKVLGHYEPAPGQEYSAFTSGDKVAAVGAVGVLAALAGVQYGKTALAGLLGVVVLILKKAWFLILLPFIWLKNLFTRNRGS